jgi:hypothetical protein
VGRRLDQPFLPQFDPRRLYIQFMQFAQQAFSRSIVIARHQFGAKTCDLLSKFRHVPPCAESDHAKFIKMFDHF